jgi:hypothetical protein
MVNIQCHSRRLVVDSMSHRPCRQLGIDSFAVVDNMEMAVPCRFVVTDMEGCMVADRAVHCTRDCI